jgi:hypothetical protein
MKRKEKRIPNQQMEKVPSAEPLTNNMPMDNLPQLRFPAEETSAARFSSSHLPAEDAPTSSTASTDLAAKKLSLSGQPLPDLPTQKISLAGLPAADRSVEDLPTRKISLAGLPAADRSVEDLPTRKISLAGLSAPALPNDAPAVPVKPQPSLRTEIQQNPLQFAIKCLILAICIGLATYGIFHTWSSTIATDSIPPETFTELYFENSTQLPSVIVPRHTYTFQFTLHNLEDKDMKYTYEVYLAVGKNKLIFDKGTIFVKVNDYKTIQEKFVSSSLLPRSEVIVDLTNENQQIDFYVEGKAKE